MKTLKILILAAFALLIAPTIQAQTTAPKGKLPVITLHRAAAHDSTAVAKTSDGQTIYRGSRGGMYYWSNTGHKRYLSKAEKAEIEGNAKQ